MVCPTGKSDISALLMLISLSERYQRVTLVAGQSSQMTAETTTGDSAKVSGRVRLAEAHRLLLRALSYGATFREVANIATEWAMELLDAEGASATLVHEGELQYISARGSVAHLLGRHLELGDSFTGQVIRERQPRVYDPNHASSASRERARHDAIQSGVLAPVLFEDRVAGTIGVTSKTPDKFTKEDIEVLSSLAESFALSLALARKQADLEAARVAAESADRAKSMFLATMSHEIRSPMTVIVGMAELLGDTRLDRAQQEYVAGVRGASQALLRIIDDILDFSKAEAGRLTLENAELELRSLVGDVLDLLAAKAQTKGLEIVGEVSPQVPARFFGDAGRIRQVLSNLVENAIKYTQEGEVLVRVERESDENDPVWVRFTVQDTGSGIPSEHHRSVFDVFTQVDGSSTRRTGGTGLGLAIAKKIVLLLGGRIGLDSEPGRGSTFWFSLPLPPKRDATSQVEMPAADLIGLRAIVACAQEATQRHLQRLLSRWGMQVEVADSAAQALELLRVAAGRDRPIKLALVDLSLPDTDGLTLAASIKSDAVLATTALVLLAAQAERGQAAKARESGVGEYLTKPVRERRLRDCVGLVLGLRAASEDPSQQGPLVARHPSAEMLARNQPRVLLAEDLEQTQRLVTNMLGAVGFLVDVVRDGQAAVEAMATTSYDAVLMDCEMPEMDGFAATKAIRDLPEPARYTPIIALTAYALPGDRDRCLRAGMDDYLSKPFSAEALVAVVKRYLFHGV